MISFVSFYKHNTLIFEHPDVKLTLGRMTYKCKEFFLDEIFELCEHLHSQRQYTHISP